jgi:hypothetical protein
MKSRIYLLTTATVVGAIVFGLPGSAQAQDADDHQHNHSAHGTISLVSIVRPLGICALSSLVITFLIGLFRRRLGRRFLKVHRVLAYLTVGIALSHGILVLVLF